MNKIVILVAMVALSFRTNAQKCSLFEEGQKVNFTMQGYFSMMAFSPDWAKMKTEKKADKI